MPLTRQAFMGPAVSTSRFMALFGDDELVYDQVCIGTNYFRQGLRRREGA